MKINFTKLLAHLYFDRPIGTTGDWGNAANINDQTSQEMAYAFKLERQMNQEMALGDSVESIR